MSRQRDKDGNEHVVNPDVPTESEKARVILALRNSARAGLLAGTPKYRIVLALQDQGLKLETARALVALAERDLTVDDFREAGLIPDDQAENHRDEAQLIRELEAMIRANYED